MRGTTTGPCPQAGCTARSERRPDDLSYALGHHVWVCAGGHREPARARTGDGAQTTLSPPAVEGPGGALPALAEAMAAGLPAPQLLRTAVRAARSGPADAVAALLVDGVGRAGTGVAAGGDDPLDGAGVLALARLAAQEGPALAAVLAGATVTVGDVEATGGHWTAFSRAATARGLRAVHAAPMRLRDEVVGVLVLLSATPHAFGAAEQAAARALADLAAVGVLLTRSAGGTGSLPLRLRESLEGRVRIERAVGVVAERDDLDVPDARAALRALARSAGVPLQEAARAVLDRPAEASRPVLLRGGAPEADAG